MSDDDSDREGDPFENLDPPEEREGDPFERLDAPVDDTDDPIDDGSPSTPDGPDSVDDASPADGVNTDDDGVSLDPSDVVSDSGAGVDSQPGDSGDPVTDVGGEPGHEADPFGDAAPGDSTTDVGTATGDAVTDAGSDDPFDGAGDPFADSGDRGDPFQGGESVFERVDVGEIDADDVWAEITGEADSDRGSQTPDGSRYAEVSKHRYCEQCPHFSGPPEIHCSNEGTEILEFVDMETVRLLDCPVVAEQRELGDEE